MFFIRILSSESIRPPGTYKSQEMGDSGSALAPLVVQRPHIKTA